jgi:hypothetical protein
LKPLALYASCFPVCKKELLFGCYFMWLWPWKFCCPVSWGFWHSRLNSCLMKRYSGACLC